MHPPAAPFSQQIPGQHLPQKIVQLNLRCQGSALPRKPGQNLQNSQRFINPEHRASLWVDQVPSFKGKGIKKTDQKNSVGGGRV